MYNLIYCKKIESVEIDITFEKNSKSKEEFKNFLDKSFFNLMNDWIFKNRKKFIKIFNIIFTKLNNDNLEVFWDFIREHFEIFVEKLDKYESHKVFKNFILDLYTNKDNVEKFIEILSVKENFEIFLRFMQRKSLHKLILSICKNGLIEDFIDKLSKNDICACLNSIFNQCTAHMDMEDDNLLIKEFLENTEKYQKILNELFKYLYLFNFSEEFWTLMSDTCTKDVFYKYLKKKKEYKIFLRLALIEISKSNEDYCKKAFSDFIKTISTTKIILKKKNLFQIIDFKKEELNNILKLDYLDEESKQKILEIMNNK